MTTTATATKPKPKAARELAAKVLEQITTHPETHQQETWWEKSDGSRGAITVGSLFNMGVCGTVGCVAGWTVALSDDDSDPDERIDDRAHRLLALTSDETMWLFACHRTHDEVTAALQRIVDGQPVLAS